MIDQKIYRYTKLDYILCINDEYDTLGILNVSIWIFCPCIGYWDVWILFIYTTMNVDISRCVFHLNTKICCQLKLINWKKFWCILICFSLFYCCTIRVPDDKCGQFQLRYLCWQDLFQVDGEHFDSFQVGGWP